MKQVVGTLLAVVVLVVSALAGARIKPSVAATSQLFFYDSCSGSGSNGTFSWQGNDPSAVQQWLDLTLFDNGWQDGTFISAGPFDGSVTSFTWNGLLPGTTHFVRVNQQFADGTWDPSPTFQITTGCVGSPPTANDAANLSPTPTQETTFGISATQLVSMPPLVCNDSSSVPPNSGLDGICLKVQVLGLSDRQHTVHEFVNICNSGTADQTFDKSAVGGRMEYTWGIGKAGPRDAPLTGCDVSVTLTVDGVPLGTKSIHLP